MTNFVIPTLDFPHISRISPHASDAELHVRAWLRERGLVRGHDSGRFYDSSRFGELVGRVYYGAALPELELLADWIAIWAIFDDHQETMLRNHDLGRFEHVARSVLGCLDDHHDSVDLEDGGPLAMAFRDVWIRTCERTSRDWQERFVEDFREDLDGCRWELDNIDARRIPELSAYINMRRRFGGMKPSIDLAELGGRYEVPQHVLADRQIQALREALADVELWANDIYGLGCDLTDRNPNNLVLVIQNERKCRLQEAADVAAAMWQDRVDAFLKLEACVLRNETGRPAADQNIISTYIQSMRSWMRGSIDWGMTSGRYWTQVPIVDRDPDHLATLMASAPQGDGGLAADGRTGAAAGGPTSR